MSRLHKKYFNNIMPNLRRRSGSNGNAEAADIPFNLESCNKLPSASYILAATQLGHCLFVYLQPLSCYSISSSGHSKCLPGSHQSHMLMQQVAIGIQSPPPSIGAKKFAHPHRNYFIYPTSLTAPQGLLCNPIRRRDSQYPHKPPFHLLRLSRHSILS